MALLDFLKNKKDAERSRKPFDKAQGKPEKKPVKASVVKVEKKEEKKSEKPEVVKTTAGKGFSYESVKQPHISEKASFLAEKDQYVFQISARCNKKEAKDAVEGLYGVNVLSVNIITIPAKKRRMGRTEGFRKAYRKAVVTIKNGQKIEIL